MIKLRRKKIKQWMTIQRSPGGEVHVVPLDDDDIHLYEECACGPTTKPLPRDDGSMGWVITHTAFDGRTN